MSDAPPREPPGGGPPARPGSREHQSYLERIAIAHFEKEWGMVGTQLDVASRLAVLGLQTLYLANGGAVIALLGAAHTLFSPSERVRLIAPLALFAFGVLSTMIANLLGYWSQAALSSSRENWVYAKLHAVMKGEGDKVDDPDGTLGERLWLIAMLFAVGAIACAAAGTLFSLCALY